MLLSLLALGACGGRQPTEPRPVESIAGTYQLTGVDGVALPRVVRDLGQCEGTGRPHIHFVRDGTLTLEANKFTAEHVLVDACGTVQSHVATTYTWRVKGTYAYATSGMQMQITESGAYAVDKRITMPQYSAGQVSFTWYDGLTQRSYRLTFTK
ncbi:MAG TPA: hypothetical protein VF615_25650 [Longimicrobiaceae bacterium]